VEKGIKIYIVRKINVQIFFVRKLKLVENAGQCLNGSPFMLKASLCRFTAGRFVLQRLNRESVIPSFFFESRLLSVKLSLKIGCGLFRRLYKFGIFFSFMA